MSLPTSCRKCGKPGKSVCDGCQQLQQRRRPSRQTRGYDGTYDRNRREIVSQVLRDPAVLCCLCHRGFAGVKPSDITAEHRIPLRYGGSSELSNLSPAHSWCNYGWRRKRT
jgi:hypothetical protein